MTSNAFLSLTVCVVERPERIGSVVSSSRHSEPMTSTERHLYTTQKGTLIKEFSPGGA
jgi:hypothetical protein